MSKGYLDNFRSHLSGLKDKLDGSLGKTKGRLKDKGKRILGALTEVVPGFLYQAEVIPQAVPEPLLHEFGHKAALETMGYEAEIEGGHTIIKNTSPGSFSPLEKLLTFSAGPLINLGAAGALIYFLNMPIREGVGGLGSTFAE